MKQYKIKWPKPSGKLAIYPSIENGQICEVNIIGDPEGLRYLASVLRVVAEVDREKCSIPSGAYVHLHLRPECELIDYSSSVMISRADEKGSGALMKIFDE
ncbi:MAG TPA: hypothetical protein PKM57_03920 [Kiritimatiellia bacterium]|nr:hypothetical protein [Kiritimatiellia bacterium]HPS09604.1 hypothetical protein [Kiritimatiellia bacterium]